MHVLYPENPLNTSQADEPYHEEFVAVRAAGLPCSLFDFDLLQFGEFNPHPQLIPGEQILYRGWMLNPQSYQTLVKQMEKRGGIPITPYGDYLRCHHLPGWYSQCAKYTAETYFFKADDELEQNIQALGWDHYFVKDFVKSNTVDKGSIAQTPAEALSIVDQLATYRGETEGGVAIRRVASYRPNTEQRYFVVRGIAHAPSGAVPQLVKTIAKIIDAPFYSMDVIENSAGELRLVELGDGQVSDKKNWSVSQFLEVILANA